MLGRKCAFRGVLELTFEDGTKQLFGTDSLNWKAGLAGPVKHAAIFDGEIYDEWGSCHTTRFGNAGTHL